VTYAVPRRVIAALAVVAVAAAAIAVTLDGPGRLLFAVLALGAAAEATRSIALRPTVRAGENGIDVAHGLRREHLAWHDITSIGTLDPPGSGRKLRRRANALEIDLDDRLVVVAGYRLGVSVTTAADALGELRSSFSVR